MRTRNICITVEEELLNSIDNICKDFSSQKKVKYTRSQFFTEASLFLIAMSQAHTKKTDSEKTKEEN